MLEKVIKANAPGIIIGLLFIFVAGVFAKDGSESNTINRWRAPETAKAITNPLKVTPEVINAGKSIFVQQCAVCHGTSGKGDGPSAQYLGKKLPDFTSQEFAQQTDGEIFWKVSNGNAPMPTFKNILPEEQRWQVISYIRTFASHK